MQKYALVSVSNKSNIISLANFLLKQNYKILSSGGTYKHLIEQCGQTESPTQELYRSTLHSKIINISDYTGSPEILGGRVKTLHPKIHGGILARKEINEDLINLKDNNINLIEVVVVNLYPFKETINKDNCTLEEAIENIDIGGPTLIRAAAKNFKHVLVLSNPLQYLNVIENFDTIMTSDESNRFNYAVQAFQNIADYDNNISNYLTNKGILNNEHIVFRKYTLNNKLKYGCNPHQKSAGIWLIDDKPLPFTVLNGSPGYINVLDAINSWNLVIDLERSLELLLLKKIPCASSFKHTSPAGVGTGIELSDMLKKVYNANDLELTPTAIAFIRARQADPLSSFGDFISISSIVDECTANLIKKEISDGIIALGYTPEALAILKTKKNGNYIILQANSNVDLNNTEIRELMGNIALSQKTNTQITNLDYFDKRPTEKKDIPMESLIDLMIANTTLKYTQSNSIVYARNGQVIGVGAGQQNRVDCVKLAGKKSLVWYLRQHSQILWIFDQFKQGTKKQDKINFIFKWIDGNIDTNEYNKMYNMLSEPVNHNIFPDPTQISNLTDLELKELLSDKILGGKVERDNFIKSFDQVSLASDAFFPFRDSIDEANKIGVSYIMQPGGSIADQSVIQACNEHNMVMLNTDVRVFTH